MIFTDFYTGQRIQFYDGLSTSQRYPGTVDSIDPVRGTVNVTWDFTLTSSSPVTNVLMPVQFIYCTDITPKASPPANGPVIIKKDDIFIKGEEQIEEEVSTEEFIKQLEPYARK